MHSLWSPLFPVPMASARGRHDWLAAVAAGRPAQLLGLNETPSSRSLHMAFSSAITAGNSCNAQVLAQSTLGVVFGYGVRAVSTIRGVEDGRHSGATSIPYVREALRIRPCWTFRHIEARYPKVRNVFTTGSQTSVHTYSPSPVVHGDAIPASAPAIETSQITP